MTDRLYELLPAFHRMRDSEVGEPLRALLALAELELDLLEGDVERLYDDLFIETAAQWVVPYLGDLLGVRAIHANPELSLDLRSYVANTLGYRRRKGTPAVLEALARDITGYPARVAEAFQRLGWNQNLNHLRLHAEGPCSLRSASDLELVGGPFDRTSRTADVRRIASGRGIYNLPNVALFLFPLPVFDLSRASALPAGDGRYHAFPLALEAPLFNRPRTEAAIAHLAEEVELPVRLRRRPLFDELESLRRSVALGTPHRARYFEPSAPAVRFFFDGSDAAIPPESVAVCDLTDDPATGAWRVPPASRAYGDPPVVVPIRVAFDPATGRIALPPAVRPGSVEVSYSYAHSSGIGAHPSARTDALHALLEERGFDVDWQRGVSKSPDPPEVLPSLADAIAAWNAQPDGTHGLIVIEDSRLYDEVLDTVRIGPGSKLAICGARWPLEPHPEIAGAFVRDPGRFSADGLRAHVRGTLRVEADAGSGGTDPGAFVVAGLLCEGMIAIEAGSLETLDLLAATVVRSADDGAAPAVDVGGDHVRLSATIARSIVGPCSFSSGARVALVDALADAFEERGGGSAVDAPESALVIEGSTVLGAVDARTLEASNSLLLGLATIERRQEGCVRFSWVEPGSRTPRRYRCEPDRALDARAIELGVDSLPLDERARVIARVAPRLRSRRFGGPRYALLERAPAELFRGADDGAEMGALHHMRRAHREDGVVRAMDEYLRFGLEAGLHFIE